MADSEITTDSEFEINIGLLEDMCSELEESIFLLDKQFNVVWINNMLKQKFSMNGFDTSKPSTYNIALSSIYGINILTDPNLKKAFSEGKFSKSISTHDTIKSRIIYLPIRYNSEVAFILCLIDEKATPLIDKSNIIKYFLNTFRRPVVFVSEDKTTIVPNKLFEKYFSKSPTLKNLIINSLHQKPVHALKYLKSLLALSHTVNYKILRDKKTTVGVIYTFSKK